MTHDRNRGKGAALRTGFAVVERRVRDRPGRRPRVRPARVRRAARTARTGRRRRRVRVALPHRPAAPGPVLLALARQPRRSRCCRTCSPTSTSPTWRRATSASAARCCDSVHAARGPLRRRARAHRQGRRRRLADLRGRHLLRRAHLRRGQEDRLARRRVGPRSVCSATPRSFGVGSRDARAPRRSGGGVAKRPAS